MSLEVEIPFETKERYQYIVSFTQFHSIPKNYKIKIINVSIILVSSSIEFNSLSTLNKFIEIILTYLEKNNVIIYFYCDTASIKMRQNRKENYSNQEFRFNLFLAMFNKLKSNSFYLQPIIINDPERGNHYTALISRILNQKEVELVKSDIETLNK